MAYYINLLTPETYEAFSQTARNVVGFRERQRALAEEIQPGDMLICYVLKTAKLVGVLEVVSQTYRDDKPLFAKENDPYTVRMDVKTRSWLSLADAVPDNSDIVWNNLSFTKLIPKSSLIWTGMFRGSLRKLEDPDGKHLEWVLNDKSAAVGKPEEKTADEVEESPIQEQVVETAAEENASVESVNTVAKESEEVAEAETEAPEEVVEEEVLATAPENSSTEEAEEMVTEELPTNVEEKEAEPEMATEAVEEEVPATTEVHSSEAPAEDVSVSTPEVSKTAEAPVETVAKTPEIPPSKAPETPMQELTPTFEIKPQTAAVPSSAASHFDTPAQMNITIPANDAVRLPNMEEDLKNIARMQAMLAEIGERMNLKVWIPMEARNRVLQYWKPQSNALLDTLPLNLDDLTLRTVENIDVLWVRNRSIARAFEVEDSSFYHKGILRMADLLAMQSGLMIHAYIVGPAELQNAVLGQITRPVFALMNGGSLASACSFISYDSVEELSHQKHLEYMTDVVLDEYSMHAPVV